MDTEAVLAVQTAIVQDRRDPVAAGPAARAPAATGHHVRLLAHRLERRRDRLEQLGVVLGRGLAEGVRLVPHFPGPYQAAIALAAGHRVTHEGLPCRRGFRKALAALERFGIGPGVAKAEHHQKRQAQAVRRGQVVGDLVREDKRPGCLLHGIPVHLVTDAGEASELHQVQRLRQRALVLREMGADAQVGGTDGGPRRHDGEGGGGVAERFPIRAEHRDREIVQAETGHGHRHWHDLPARARLDGDGTGGDDRVGRFPGPQFGHQADRVRLRAGLRPPPGWCACRRPRR